MKYYNVEKLIDEFLKDPFGKINLKRLCEGESKKTVERARKEILKIAEKIKKAKSKAKK